jgi:hypothetical protein
MVTAGSFSGKFFEGPACTSSQYDYIATDLPTDKCFYIERANAYFSVSCVPSGVVVRTYNDATCRNVISTQLGNLDSCGPTVYGGRDYSSVITECHEPFDNAATMTYTSTSIIGLLTIIGLVLAMQQ